MSTNAQLDNIYQPLLIACTLCEVSLEECAIRMRPSWVYTLHVPNQLLPFSIMLVKKIGAFTQDHPFAPHINVVLDKTLDREEWYVKNESGEAWGSEGL